MSPSRARWTRRPAAARALAGLAVSLVAVIGMASPAGAHAELRSTEPAANSRLDEAPGGITLSFTEPVAVTLGGIRLFDEHGDRVGIGAVERRLGGATVFAALPDLDTGGYVVSWSVVSSDGHSIRGTFTFRVGSGGDDTALQGAAREIAEQGGDRAVDVAYAAARVLAFATLLVTLGATVFATFVGDSGTGRGARRVGLMAVPVAVVATGAVFALQGADLSGAALADVLDPGTLGAVADTRFGQALLARGGLLVALGASLGLAPSARALQTSLVVALAFTPAVAGHASTGRWVPLAIVTDAGHVLAAATWLGGLLAVLVVAAPGREGADVRGLDRFSRLAFVAVVALAGTGAVQSLRQVGGIDALRGTNYGRLLLVKVALFLAVLVLAALSRRSLRARRSNVRWTALAELAVGSVVVAVTALLVNVEPARSALARPATATIETSQGLVIDVTVDPARAGPVDLHVYTFSAAGSVREVEELRLTLALGSRGLDPLEVDLARAGPGHFSAYGVDVPIAGSWTITVAARLGGTEQASGSSEVTIRSG